MSINLIVLVGNAGRDPELRFFESGSCVCEFTLAVNRPPRDGQNQEPLWVNCKAWGKTAQVAGDYLRKGSKVAVVGRLEIEQWTDRSSGEVRSKTLVVIDRLELCGSRNGTQQIDGAADLAAFSAGQSVSSSASQTATAAAGGSRSPSATTWGTPAGAPTPAAPAAPAWSTSGPISDEEVPF
jgi:single-strand DNA-binding protein